MRSLLNWIRKYERHLSGAAMIAGFIVDNIFFGRIDQVITHEVFIGYLVIAAASIAWLHHLETRSTQSRTIPSRWRSLYPLITQFALGGLWSGFLIFYTRSATLSASWPFLLILGAIFVGNEIFRQYHDQLVFTTVLYFFALYSYAIFAVPVLTGDISTGTFLLSGVLAVGVFAAYMVFLRRVGRERYMASVWQVRFFAALVLVVMNVLYFTNLLPPLPLALSSAGVYHRVLHVAGGFEAIAEKEPWYVSLGIRPTFHVADGDTLTAYSAVFAPIDLTTTITHRWQYYDPKAQKWLTESVIPFPISGGREAGYRGYTSRGNLVDGLWRVNIETADGRTVGRLTFTVVVGAAAQTETIPL